MLHSGSFTFTTRLSRLDSTIAATSFKSHQSLSPASLLLFIVCRPPGPREAHFQTKRHSLAHSTHHTHNQHNNHQHQATRMPHIKITNILRPRHSFLDAPPPQHLPHPQPQEKHALASSPAPRKLTHARHGYVHPSLIYDPHQMACFIRESCGYMYILPSPPPLPLAKPN